MLDLVPVYDLFEQMTPDGRYYVTPQGNEYPSVTTILSRQPKPELAEWKERIGPEEAAKQLRQSILAGNALHEACECHLLEKEIPAMRQSVRWMYNALKPELNKISVVRGIELPLWSDYLKVAGRTDCVGVYEDELSIIDFKNSKRHKEERFIEDYFLQTTTYAMMFMGVYKIPVRQVVVMVGLWDGGKQIFKQPVKKRLQKVEDLMKQYNDLW